MKNLIKYQDLDGQMIKIENDLKKSEERKKLVKTKVFLDEFDATILKMEQRAGELVGSFHGCKKRMQELLEEIAEYESMDLGESTEDEINYLQGKTQKLRDSLRGMEKDGETIAVEIEKLSKEFEIYREKVGSAKKDYSVYKEKFDAKKAEAKPLMDKLKKQMEELETAIGEEFLSAYKKARKEKLYPVFVPLVEGNCGGCGMDLALSIISAVESNKYIKCEHCGKLIYKD